MKNLYESILSSTKSGAQTVILDSIINYLKTFTDKDSKDYIGWYGCESLQLYVPGRIIPGISNRTYVDDVLVFMFPKKKIATKITQWVRMAQKMGYKSYWKVPHDNKKGFLLSDVQEHVYYAFTEHNNGGDYWDNRIIRLGNTRIVFAFVKSSNQSVEHLYVYTLTENRTADDAIVTKIKDSL